MKNWFFIALGIALSLLIGNLLLSPSKPNNSFELIIKKASEKIKQAKALETPGEHIKPITVLLLGRNQAEKSYLANKIAETNIFKENITTPRETYSVLPSQDGEGSFILRVIDTPGLPENLAEKSSEDALSSIVNFVEELQGGVDIAIYCLPVGAEYDAEELKVIGRLFESDLFGHSLVAVTKMHTLISKERMKKSKEYPQELSIILQRYGILDFSSKNVLFADFNLFSNNFMMPFSKFVAQASSSKPQLPKNLNLNMSDSEELRAFITSPPMQRVILNLDKALKTTTEATETMLELAKVREERYERELEKKQAEIDEGKKTLQTIHQKLEGNCVENSTMRLLEEENAELRHQVNTTEGVIQKKEDEIRRLNQEILNLRELSQVKTNSPNGILSFFLGSVLFVFSIAGIIALLKVSETLHFVVTVFLMGIIAVLWILWVNFFQS